MANMLYNGVELPALPEWDKETYPFAKIHLEGARYYLQCYSDPLVFNGSNVVTSDYSYIIRYIYRGEGVVWIESGSEYTEDAGERQDYGTLIWTNTDIIDTTDGTLYFAASAPVDPNAPDVPELSITPLGAFLLGQQLRRNLAAVREPVAYLYNGVRLPPIPAEIAKYPYIVMYQEESTGSFANYCWLVGMSVAPSSWENDMTFYTEEVHGMSESGELRRAGAYPDSDAWTVMNDIETARYSNNLSKVKWASYDVLAIDGSLYLAKSEPVPVYE